MIGVMPGQDGPAFFFEAVGVIVPYAAGRYPAVKHYKQVNGTNYDARTPDEVVVVLEKARLNRQRVHVSLGYTEGPEAGRDWLEENMVHGFIGRSTGSVRIPLIVHNRRSLGGPGLLDHCIVRIRTAAGGHLLWQHPQYHHGLIQIRPKAEPLVLEDGRILRVDVLRDGQVQAAFEDVTKARRYIRKLGVQAEIVG